MAKITDHVDIEITWPDEVCGDYNVPRLGTDECSKFIMLHWEENLLDLTYEPMRVEIDNAGCMQSKNAPSQYQADMDRQAHGFNNVY
ncbi:hypothetical protein KAR91_53275 [Candidatus Pacearchaeota archaeon]|nr:hypothetical protein [Candidatus Pacearchaeota archaeon]